MSVGGAICFGAVVGWALVTGGGPGLMLWSAKAGAAGAGAGTVFLTVGPAGVAPTVVGLASGAGLHMIFRFLVRAGTASAGTFKGDR